MVDLIFVALLQAVAGDPTAPGEAIPQTTATEPAAEAEDEGIRCERQPIVGTRLSQRVCTTAAQRREMQEYARAQINRGQGQQWTPPPPRAPGPMGQ